METKKGTETRRKRMKRGNEKKNGKQKNGDKNMKKTSASVILLPRPDMKAGTKEGGAGCVVNS